MSCVYRAPRPEGPLNCLTILRSLPPMNQGDNKNFAFFVYFPRHLSSAHVRLSGKSLRPSAILGDTSRPQRRRSVVFDGSYGHCDRSRGDSGSRRRIVSWRDINSLSERHCWPFFHLRFRWLSGDSTSRYQWTASGCSDSSVSQRA